jgi:hypothetical protein
LPRIDEGDLAVGLPGGVLLVFPDPNCGPRRTGRPAYEIGLRRPAQVLREPRCRGRTRQGRAGLTFPIVLQKQWEVSLQYGMFATPVGYLIDEQGILASDVAVGVRPILALAGEGAHESYAGESRPLAAKQALAI